MSTDEYLLTGNADIDIPKMNYPDADAQADLITLRAKLSGSFLVPGLKPEDGMDILDILINREDDREAYFQIKRMPIFPTFKKDLTELRASIAKLFSKSSISAEAVHARLNRITDIHLEYRNRE
jgi:hypothetical protein